MKVEILAERLRERYDNAKRNETILEIDLFGIEYGKEIRGDNISIKEIIQLSGIGASYITELSKAVKLSEYVISKGRDRKE